jgi:sugar phosphate isomerase/epimerase
MIEPGIAWPFLGISTESRSITCFVLEKEALLVQLGLFSQLIHASSVEELAERVREFDLQCVVLDSYLGLPLDLNAPAPDLCRRIRNAFAQAHVTFAAVGGYCNLVHPDPQQRQQIHRQFEGLMRLCAEIGAPMLCSETGTYHPQSAWDWDPANVTEQAFQELLQTLRPLARKARSYGVTLGLEPYVMNIIGTPERAARLIDELGEDNVRLVCDPAGILSRTTLNDQQTFLTEAFRLTAKAIGLVHVEDCTPDPQGHFLWQAAGSGLINYPLFMDLLVQSGYDGALILEHLSEESVPPARTFVLDQWQHAQERARERAR